MDNIIYTIPLAEWMEYQRQIIREELAVAMRGSTASNDDPIGINEAEKFLGLKKQTVYGLVSKRQIPFHKKCSKLFFIKSELLSWLKEGDEKADAELLSIAENNITRHKKRRKTA